MSHLKGESLKIIMIIMLGWTGFAFADATSKSLSTNYDPSLILLFSGLTSGLGLIIWIFLQRGWRGFLSPNWKWLMARGACIAVTATGVVNGVSYIPLADLYGITFSAPFITVILAVIFLREEVGTHRWISVILGFSGVLILLGPQFDQFNIGIAFAVAATISIAVGTIVIRKIGSSEYLPLFILYPYMGILVVNIPLSIPHIEPIAVQDLWWFISNSAFVLIGQLAVTYAIANAKSTASVAPFVYIQVIWGVLLGLMFFSEIPTTTTMVGLILVVIAGLYMIYRERQLSKNT